MRTFFPDAPNVDGAAPIPLQVGQSLTGMDIRLRSLPTYHVRGLISGALKVSPESLSVGITPTDSGLPFSSAASSVQVELGPSEEAMRAWHAAYAKQDGTFSIESVGSDKYDLELWPTPDGTYIKSVQLGQQEMLGKELDFTQGVAGELLITLSYGVAEADGTVQMPDQGSSSGTSNKPATAAIRWTTPIS